MCLTFIVILKALMLAFTPDTLYIYHSIVFILMLLLLLSNLWHENFLQD